MTSKEEIEVCQIDDPLLCGLGLEYVHCSNITDELGENEDIRASSAAELVNSKEGLREVF